MGFKETQPKQLPKWLSGKDHLGHSEGVAFEESFGATKDTELDLLKDATKVRWPQTGPDDALIYQGNDRILLQAPVAESFAQFRVRLATAHDLWLWGGTRRGFSDRFAPYGFTAATAHVYNNHEILWDTNTAQFARVFVLLEADYWTVDGVWDDPGDYDDGGLWNTTMTTPEADYIRKSLRAWKSPQAYPVAVGLVLGNAPSGDGFWNSIGFYDDGLFWDDSGGDVMYLPIGHVWGEEAWLGGGPGIWGTPGDVWDDFVPPTGGWNLPFCL